LVCQSLHYATPKGPRNCRSLGSPGFPVESCGFGQLHVVLFRENHISGAGESCEVGNPGTLLMNERRVWCRTSGARRLPMDPALPGWADFWCRPSGPGLQTPLSHVHSSLSLPQASRLLGMTKGGARRFHLIMDAPWENSRSLRFAAIGMTILFMLGSRIFLIKRPSLLRNSFELLARRNFPQHQRRPHSE
jgi:hypothetical protein